MFVTVYCSMCASPCRLTSGIWSTASANRLQVSAAKPAFTNRK
jgi:hypothetical protein